MKSEIGSFFMDALLMLQGDPRAMPLRDLLRKVLTARTWADVRFWCAWILRRGKQRTLRWREPFRFQEPNQRQEQREQGVLAQVSRSRLRHLYLLTWCSGVAAGGRLEHMVRNLSGD